MSLVDANVIADWLRHLRLDHLIKCARDAGLDLCIRPLLSEVRNSAAAPVMMREAAGNGYRIVLFVISFRGQTSSSVSLLGRKRP